MTASPSPLLVTTVEKPRYPPSGCVGVARREVVSWLRAASLAFPTLVSGVVSTRVILSEAKEGLFALRLTTVYCPLQWRGRTGISPVSVSPVRNSVVNANLCALFALGKRGGQLGLECAPL